MKGVPDYRKSLQVLQSEWKGCTDCELGKTRVLRNGRMVFGVGRVQPHGILFVTGEPGYDEEREGKPIAGRPARMLSDILERYMINSYFITSVVACRSCAPMLDEQGNVILSNSYGGSMPAPKFKDQPATKPELDACASRLAEEIYMVDPLLIVTFGQVAAAALRGSSFNLTKERGYPEVVTIPGAGAQATLSAKKQEWIRKVKGVTVAPTARPGVQYLSMPTLHPSEVHRSLLNELNGNPYQLFTKDLYKVKRIYNAYNEELHGVIPDDMTGVEETPYDIADKYRAEEEDNG